MRGTDARPGPPGLSLRARHDQPLIWIASFPKSGNTWTRVLFGNFLADGHGTAPEGIATVGNIAANRLVFDETIGIPSSDLTADEIDLLRAEPYRRIARAAGAPTFIKVHDALQRDCAGDWILPPECSRGAILLVRHPFDVALSFAHHIGDATPERAVDKLCDPGHVMAGDGNRQMHQRTLGWSGHYLSWTRQHAIPVLVVRYEDMIADAAAQFRRMIEFLGLPGADDSGRIARAVELSRFERLQSIEARDGFDEIAVNAERFFRSGRTGEGIERLPAALRARIAAENAPVMAELGYSQSGTAPL